MIIYAISASTDKKDAQILQIDCGVVNGIVCIPSPFQMEFYAYRSRVPIEEVCTTPQQAIDKYLAYLSKMFLSVVADAEKQVSEALAKFRNGNSWGTLLL